MRPTMEVRNLFLLYCLFLGISEVNAAPRGDTIDERKLRGPRVGADKGGAAGRAGFKTPVRREPITLPPQDLPIPLSDHSATGLRGLIYIAGGCDSVRGNEFTVSGVYSCSSISDKLITFDPSVFSNQFNFLPNLPRPRYRHTSVSIGNELWLIGGRDVNDVLIDQVDVFNIDTQLWTSFSLPSINQVSDHASYTRNGYIYVAGGYDQSYNTLNAVYKINTDKSITSLAIEDVDPLMTSRGDLAAAQTSDYALVAGGFTNGGCDVVGVVEKYEFATAQWTSLAPMNNPRADFGMIRMLGLTIALGGEYLRENFCSNPGNDLTEFLEPVTTPEVLVEGPNQWANIDEDLFDLPLRAAHVGWSATDAIYTIGGQMPFDPTCNCYPTTTNIRIHRRIRAEAEILSVTPSPSPAPVSMPVPTQQPVMATTPAPVINLTTGNDRCENAARLLATATGSGRTIIMYGNTVGASVDDLPTCNRIPSDQPGVWFYVLGTQGIMTALTCNPFTDFDTRLTIYRGSCGSLECVTANDDNCPVVTRASRVSWEATRGEIYYIQVHGFPTDPVGNFGVRVQSQTPPNDNCGQAIPVAVGESINGSTIYAHLNFGGTGQAFGQTCQTSYGNVEGIWYSTIGTGNTMTADTCGSRTDYNTKLHVFTGNCVNDNDSLTLTCVRGNDDSSECGSLTDRRSLVRWSSQAGVRYYIYVHGFQAVPSRGLFTLTIREEI